MSKTFTFTALIPVVAVVLALVPTAFAANSRSWVSNTGTDANPCTIDKPCATFQRAHDVTTSGGEIDVLNPGDYNEVVINRAITIDGGNMAYIYVAYTQAGITVNAPTDAPVVIRNLAIKTMPGVTDNVGIYYGSAYSLHAENLFISGTGIGIQAAMYKGIVRGQLYVKDTTIRNNGNSGIALQGVTAETGIAHAVIDHVTMEQAKDCLYALNAQADVSNSVFSLCSDAGVLAYGYSKINIADSTIAFSNNGVYAYSGNVVRLSSNNIHDNSFALSGSGMIESFGNNRLRGNSGNETPSATVALK